MRTFGIPDATPGLGRGGLRREASAARLDVVLRRMLRKPWRAHANDLRRADVARGGGWCGR